MAEATLLSSPDVISFVPESAIAAGQVIQLKSGKAAFCKDAISSGVQGLATVEGTVILTKLAGVVLLDGDDVFWDHSANNATYKPVDDRDFFCGTAVGDQDSASTIVLVALNVRAEYLIDLSRDGFRTSITGTQGLNTMGLFRRGGLHNLLMSSASEVQKIDALSVAGFSKDANAIVEAIFAVPNDGAGTAVDISIGIANATHGTDADSITEHLFCHLDANNVNIYFQSKDGTTTVAATDSTIDYSEGSAVANLVYVKFDLRDPTSVKIYVNGARVLPATTFNINAATGPFKLLLHGEKTSAADVYELDLHRLRVRIAEQ